MHYSFSDIVRYMARNGWGREHKTADEAMQALAQKGIDPAAAALLEIVRRIDQVAQALAQKVEGAEDEGGGKGIPEQAKPFPAAKVGDFFYYCESVDDGVTRYVVVSCLEGGHVRLVAEGENRQKAWLDWGGEFFYATEAEAIQHAAEADIAYHGPRLQRAKQALRAVKEGADLAPFRENWEGPDEETAG